ncbi:MAG: AmmeMemoRadiSam system protein B [Candidatus Magasanikbacteria bacterium RIFOXYC12_FULL_33_11]|uniref:AmmeMemoRadiSam system protein B n=1 Tax=Candidatus Magasanikbacteria bacterium RIFOXYC12_FULL_33_11 TaxID=1798701 RepID=A0A1F6NS37_9BACT|nr:MAG: AmmeMemoRadiSam system protein B [Candidatus Magasanikbacteria bacterium RIFOXYC12_FULL_33_11]
MKKTFTFLFLIIFLLPGCSLQSNVENEVKVVEESISYHYTAPWDKDFFDRFYQDLKLEKNLPMIKGGIVPHHLLAGYLDSSFFENLKEQNPSTIVVFGPNHFYKGYGKIISSEYDWHTPYGDLSTNRGIVANLKTKGLVSIEEDVINDEHSIYGILPFVKKSLPDSKVLPFIFKGDIGEEKMDEFINNLIEILPSDTVFVSSIDFSHYQTWNVSNFHDELSIDVIKSFDFASLEKLEIDSVPSLYTLMKIMEKYKTQKVVLEKHDNSAQIVGDKSADNITSYYSPYFSKGEKTEKSLTSFLMFGNKELSVEELNILKKNLSGNEDRFLYGFDFLLPEEEASEEIADVYSNKFIVDSFSELNKDKNRFALGGVLYKDKTIKFYLFPFTYEDNNATRMDYTQAQNFVKDLFAKNNIKDYNIDEFSFVN